MAVPGLGTDPPSQYASDPSVFPLEQCHIKLLMYSYAGCSTFPEYQPAAISLRILHFDHTVHLYTYFYAHPITGCELLLLLSYSKHGIYQPFHDLL